MSHSDLAWGTSPTPDYETVADRFRPIFARIAETAVERELARRLPVEEIGWLQAAGFGALRLPRAEGGSGVSLSDFLVLLIELSEADSNVTQSLRGHFGFVEEIATALPGPHRSRWAERIARGATVGIAWTEIGAAGIEGFSTRVVRKDGRLLLNGSKYYTTGSLYSDWIDVGALNDEDVDVNVVVRRDAAGVDVVDDWDGFGQTLTASGTTHFTDVEVDPLDILVADEKFRHATGFYQLVHLATLAGIGRALTKDVATAVAARRRTFSHAAAARSSQDPQVLQVVGRVRAAAYCAGAIVLQAARALEAAASARHSGDEAAEDRLNAVAELESAQAQAVVTSLVLDAANAAFDALSASATRRPNGLDRHWRNARTLSSHNPRIYKDRIVGDFAVNGTLPPYQWRIGTPAS
ncbi:MAG: monooxygenase [Rhizobiaceae bacterium]|nr:monooxygenase [Rhizobiaceae bacterium]